MPLHAGHQLRALLHTAAGDFVRDEFASSAQRAVQVSSPVSLTSGSWFGAIRICQEMGAFVFGNGIRMCSNSSQISRALGEKFRFFCFNFRVS